MEFYQIAGQMALGSRLRQLGETLMSEAEQVYKLYDVELDPRWFPVFYMLTIKKSAGITELADDIGQSHPAVSQVVKSMMAKGIVLTQKCREDARVNKVALTEQGNEIATRFSKQCVDVGDAVGDIFNATGSNLWSELDLFEREIKSKNLFQRVSEVRKAKLQAKVSLVDFNPSYEEAFRTINTAWIEKLWQMEEADHKALDNPQQSIIEQGGYITMALLDGEPIGSCALLKMADGEYELAKMAVADSAKGLGIGYMLGTKVIEKAKELGANRIYLESNSALIPALNLYRKLGFSHVKGHESPYERCDIQMELILE